MLLRFILAGIVGTTCLGQRFEIGAKGGIPVTSSFETGSSFQIDFGEAATSATRRYTVGPMIGIRLPYGFGVEFDALYRRLGFDDLIKSDALIYVHTRTTANSWEFPLLGRYRLLRFSPLTPFVDGGVSFRHATGISSVTERYVGAYPNLLIRTTGNTSPLLDARSNHGGVVGFGFEGRVAFLHISPEVRYTRWGADQGVDPYLHSNQNQFDVLLGIAFAGTGH